MTRNIDMTQGPIMRRVVLFALPICLGNVLQQLYNTIDLLVIGNFRPHSLWRPWERAGSRSSCSCVSLWDWGRESQSLQRSIQGAEM